MVYWKLHPLIQLFCSNWGYVLLIAGRIIADKIRQRRQCADLALTLARDCRSSMSRILSKDRMQIRGLLGAFAVAAVVCCSAGALGASGPETQQHTLTRARDVHDFP